MLVFVVLSLLTIILKWHIHTDLYCPTVHVNGSLYFVFACAWGREGKGWITGHNIFMIGMAYRKQTRVWCLSILLLLQQLYNRVWLRAWRLSCCKGFARSIDRKLLHILLCMCVVMYVCVLSL